MFTYIVSVLCLGYFSWFFLGCSLWGSVAALWLGVCFGFSVLWVFGGVLFLSWVGCGFFVFACPVRLMFGMFVWVCVVALVVFCWVFFYFGSLCRVFHLWFGAWFRLVCVLVGCSWVVLWFLLGVVCFFLFVRGVGVVGLSAS